MNDADVELGVIIHWVNILLEKKKLGSNLKTEKMVNCHSSKAKAHKFSKKSKRARERERERGERT